MKSKKNKKQRQNVHCEFRMSDEGCRALSNALLFLLALRDFSFEAEKINYDSADRAEEKLSCNDANLTRGEVRATAKAIDVSILCLSNSQSDYTYIDDDFPDLLADLERDMPILLELQPIFHTAVKDLSKM